jgi:hypothetical protein
MMKGLHKKLIALILGCAAGVSIAGDLPNHSLTPGAMNPEVRQDNIQSTICVKGYTKTIRPPAYYTNRLKKQQIREYGYSERNPKLFEEDHLLCDPKTMLRVV